MTMAANAVSGPGFGMRFSRAWPFVAIGLVWCGAPLIFPVGEIPPRPEAGVTTSQAVSTFAMDTLLLGEAAWDGGVSSEAWKQFGYNLDGLVTTKDSTDVCTLAPGAPSVYQGDGQGGIDNAWGAQLLPLIASGASAAVPSTDATSWIRYGAWTLLIQITGLSDDPHQTAVGLDAQVFVGAPTNGSPAFNTTTDWPVRPSSVNDGATVASGALVHFREVYVDRGKVVARDAAQPLELPLMLIVHNPKTPPTPALPLRIHHAVLTFDHVDSNTAANGTIAGVLETGETIEAGVPFAGSIGICGTSYDGVAQQIEQAQDILDDGTNVAGVACKALSLGIGFTAELVANPTTVGVDPPPLPDPCAFGDAGTE